MHSNILQCFALTMDAEGANRVSRVKSDPGNWSGGKVGSGTLIGTQWGVSAPVAIAHGLTIGKIQPEQAYSLVYEPGYWTPMDADALPAGLDLNVVDDAYNAGVGNARKLYGKVRAKGLKTPDAQISAFAAARLGFLRSLRTWNTFGKGWAARVARMETEGHKMAKTSAPMVQAHADAAQAKASSAVRKAVALPAVSGGAAVATPNDALQSIPWEAGLAAGIVLTVIVGILLWQRHAQATRAEALQSLASELKK